MVVKWFPIKIMVRIDDSVVHLMIKRQYIGNIANIAKNGVALITNGYLFKPSKQEKIQSIEYDKRT